MNCVRRAAQGFTLVEILVALAVLAIALTATARSLGAAIELSREWPDLDVKEGDADMGGRAFHWRQETGVTPAARMRRVEVSVFLPGTDSMLAKMTGFLRQTGPQSGPQAGPSR